MKKTKYLRYGLGVIFLIVFVVGLVFVSIALNKEPVERESIDYIIENVELFEDDIGKMGYQVRVAYTLDDIWEERYDEYPTLYDKDQKLGYSGRGILVIYKELEEYYFDTGFEECKIKIDMDTVIELKNNSSDKPIDLEKTKNNYPITVHVRNDELYYTNLFNSYTIDFIEFQERFRDESIYDLEIKKYITTQELQELFVECMSLQTQLVKLYEENYENKTD